MATPRLRWRAIVAGTLVGLVFMGLAGIARSDPRPDARHLWRKHLARHAAERFYPKSEIHARFYTKRAVDLRLAQGDDPGETPRPGEDGETAAPPPDDTEPDEEDGDELPALFPWAGDGGFADNWKTGLGYAALGFLGALVTVYLFLGESLPSMGGTAQVALMREELADYKTRFAAALAAQESYARGESTSTTEQLAMYEKLASRYEPRISYLETAISKTVSGSYLWGVPMYLLLGAGFAILFSANLLQALLIGFGWPAIASRAGLKRKDEAISAERKARVQELEQLAEHRINDLKSKVTALEKERDGLKTISDTLIQQVQATNP